MKVITTTNARKNISQIIDHVKIHIPHLYSKRVNEITNINVASHSFDFLSEEPEQYSSADLKKRYV